MGVQSLLLEFEYEPLHARERKISRIGFVRGRDMEREEGEEGGGKKNVRKDGAELWMGLVSRDRVKFHLF